MLFIILFILKFYKNYELQNSGLNNNNKLPDKFIFLVLRFLTHLKVPLN